MPTIFSYKGSVQVNKAYTSMGAKSYTNVGLLRFTLVTRTTGLLWILWTDPPPLRWKCTERNVWNFDLLVRTHFISGIQARFRLVHDDTLTHIHWEYKPYRSIQGAWYTSIPTYLPDPLSDFPRVWFRDYPFPSRVENIWWLRGEPIDT